MKKEISVHSYHTLHVLQRSCYKFSDI